MKVDWQRTVEPTKEAVSFADAKLHCRALEDVADEDPLIKGYLRAAWQHVELVTGRGLMTQTWVMTQDGFADAMSLPMAAPLQSVTSVKYYDTNGTQQTLSTSVYRVDTASEPGRVVLKPSQSWPVVQSGRGQTVEITYVAGWTSAEDVPWSLKAAALMIVNHLFENRSAVQIGVGVGGLQVPFGVPALVSPYLVVWRPPECA